MRNALPNASYIGFTGTPLFKDDEITRRVFGDYVSTYDFQRAVEDKATVPLYYDARGDKLGVATGDLNERIARSWRSWRPTTSTSQQRLEQELKRDYHIITADKRLESGRAGFRQALFDGLGERQGHAGLHRQDHLRADVQPDRKLLGGTHSRIGGGAGQGRGRAGRDLSPAADRLDAGDPDGGGGQRGAGRGRQVPQVGSGHHAAPEADQGRHRASGAPARQPSSGPCSGWT